VHTSPWSLSNDHHLRIGFGQKNRPGVMVEELSLAFTAGLHLHRKTGIG
jgi:hypothetical protein